MTSGDPPDPKDKTNWKFEFNPYELLGFDTDDAVKLSQKDVRKAYYSRVRKSHPDKTEGEEELTKKLNAAYNYLYERHSEKLKHMSEEFANLTFKKSGTKDKSRVIEDKTKAEHYKRVFQAHLMVAKESQFMDNFQSFYQQCFDQVTTPPEEETGYYCEICGEDFIFGEDHFWLVTAPYTEYVLDGVQLEFWEYMESLFDKETVMGSVINEIDNWTADNFASDLLSWCEKIEYLQTGGWVESLKKLKETEDPSIISLLEALFQAKEKGLNDQEICAVAVEHIPISSELCKISEVELILPALLKVKSKTPSWSKLSLQVSSTSPRFALILACAALQLDKGEDFFLQLGEHLIKFENNWKFAHLCFRLGSCDLNLVAHRILLLSGHIDCKRLAAFYFLKTKELSTLIKYGQIATNNKDFNSAAVFVLPVVRHYYEMRDIDNVLISLSHLLSGQKYWKAIQSIALDMPLAILSSAQIARVTVERVLLEFTKRKSRLIYRNASGAKMEAPSNPSAFSVKNVKALCGALHIIDQGYDDDKQIVTLRDQIMEHIKNNLDRNLNEGDVGLILASSRLPRITPVINQILENKQFLGVNAVKVTPGSTYYASLLTLRAIYHYKNREYTKMGHDLVQAAGNTLNHAISLKIAVFLAGNPMITEKLLKVASTQFQQLQAYTKDYTGEPLDAANFLEVLQKTTVDEARPKLSSGTFSVGSNSNGPNACKLEKDILGREKGDEQNKKDATCDSSFRVGGSVDKVTTYAEIAYSYTNLEVICRTYTELTCCWTMASQYFLQAMQALPDDSIAEKFGYRGVILEICQEALQFADYLQLTSPTLAIFALRTSLAFIFQANQHFSEVVRKQSVNGTTPFINEGEIPEHAEYWQEMLNLRTVCPLILPDIFTISEGRLALHCCQELYKAILVEKIESGLFSKNTMDYLYHHQLFNGVWSHIITPEYTRYEEPIRDVSHLSSEEIYEQDEPEEKERKAQVNDAIQKEKVEIEEMRRQLEQASLVERMGFQVSRANSMLYLADLYGHEIADVEMMMNWKMIRRTDDGFIDIQNRTLNFDWEEGKIYSKFLGVQLNWATKAVNFLLEPAVAGDPNRPALFSGMDIMEIFGNQISSAFLSFEENLYPPEGAVPEYVRMYLPFHPFFKVNFGGCGMDGNFTKERICGTNFLMTLYHLDLLAKFFSTGQEVGANFPFLFRDTETGLLSNVSKELQEALKPIGLRKKARLLKELEEIHRFWFTVMGVEQEKQNNGDTTTFRYGNVNVTLNTMRMERGKDGKLKDAKHLFDENSPECKFVQGFNQRIHLIEKEFPIIQRIKELAKISLCMQDLHHDMAGFPNIKTLISPQISWQARPYSRCFWTPIKKCTCCDWVPAVYHQLKVTDEQKLEYLFDKWFAQSPQNAVSEKEKLKLDFDNKHTFSQEEASEIISTEKKRDESNADDSHRTNKPWMDLSRYDLLENYRCYGGVLFQVERIISNIKTELDGYLAEVSLQDALNVVLFAAQFLPAGRIATITSRIAQLALKIIKASSRVKELGSRYGGRGPGTAGDCRGNEAHSAMNALNLKKQLACEEQLGYLAETGGIPMAGSGHKTILRDSSRLSATYGGQPSNWSKVKSTNYKAPDGASIEIHAYRNVDTGNIFEHKVKHQIGTYKAP